MIVGSGLIASSLRDFFLADDKVLIYAAGVSNSSASDYLEFDREKKLVLECLERNQDKRLIVYFSTCSIDDPDKVSTPYVMHKVAMEELIETSTNHLIIRLPQLAGRTNNPYTLLNFLYNKIRYNEKFLLHKQAIRNIIDCDDVSRILSEVVKDKNFINKKIAIANVHNHSSLEIVQCFEGFFQKKALYDAIDSGSGSNISNNISSRYASSLGIDFKSNYLEKVIRKYYSLR